MESDNGIAFQTLWYILSFPALDVSADLTELGRTPVAVISAGVKSILDIGRTLEYLVSTNQKNGIESGKW